MKIDPARMSGIDRRILRMRILEAVKESADDPEMREKIERKQIEREGKEHGVQGQT